jgi:hypothetical protein
MDSTFNKGIPKIRCLTCESNKICNVGVLPH